MAFCLGLKPGEVRWQRQTAPSARWSLRIALEKELCPTEHQANDAHQGYPWVSRVAVSRRLTEGIGIGAANAPRREARKKVVSYYI